MSAERLQKILAAAGVASRRKAEELIRQGRVTVNGQVASLGDKADPEVEAVKLDGKRIRPSTRPHRYLLLNKPRKVMSTRSDPRARPTVYDLLAPTDRKLLKTVGRLDYNSDGLILLTDDGEFANRVAHPRYGCRKTYAVKVKGTPDDDKLDKLRRGITLEGKRTAPARIRRLKKPRGGRQAVNSWWEVELAEGRTRQIREMFYRIGHPVQRLTRVAIGSLSDPKLESGSYRELTPAEVARLAGRKRAAGRRS